MSLETGEYIANLHANAHEIEHIPAIHVRRKAICSCILNILVKKVCNCPEKHEANVYFVVDHWEYDNRCQECNVRKKVNPFYFAQHIILEFK